MKLCTTCGRRWDIVGSRCPDDGTPLVAEAARAGRASASATWSSEQPALAQLRPAARHELAPGDCVGEYVIERRIGAGGMGVVYGARHPVIGKRAAIKILAAKLTADDEALSRFVLEAQAVNKIGHANIVDIFSFGTLDDGRSYFAMEWLQGETLGARLARGRLSVREACSILSPLCRALEAAHAAGVIHRDLKPDNVLLATDDDGWRVKLLDFGIAKLSTATAQVSRTATGVAMGTPLYMAPEQARGEAVDGRTDVYALGLLAYTMVCGVSLFEDEGSAIEILAAHISRPPVPPRAHAPDLPAAFDALILEMIAKQPDQRPALGEIRRRLAAIAADADRPAPPAMARGASLPIAPTEQASIAELPASRPPDMPGAPPDAPRVASSPPTLPAPTSAARAASRPPTMPGASDPLHDRSQTPIADPRSPMPAVDAPLVVGAAWRRSTTSGSITDGSAITTASRRPWWPLGLAALVALAAGGVVIAVRASSVPATARDARATQAPGAAAPPVAPGEPDGLLAQPASRSAMAAPPAARPGPEAAGAAAASSAPVAAAPAAAVPAAPPSSEPPAAAPITAELAVEPRGAQLAVDGQPVALVAGRAALALPPGEHEALASAGGRVARQRFTVTADRAVRVALRVPAPPATAAPRAAAHASDDVDGVEDPFRK
jgi:serine/threonine-protein kinase